MFGEKLGHEEHHVEWNWFDIAFGNGIDLILPFGNGIGLILPSIALQFDFAFWNRFDFACMFGFIKFCFLFEM